MTRFPFLALPVAAALLAFAGSASAQRVPPQGALPLSQIVANVEKTQPVSSFREVEWDDDGYWEVEFIDTQNRSVSIRMDPMTGEQWTRRRR